MSSFTNLLCGAGVSRERVFLELDAVKSGDLPWQERLAAAMNYPAGLDVEDVAKDAYLAFWQTNQLYPAYFPSLAKLEEDVVEAAKTLMHGRHTKGSITSGGTESILLAARMARDLARERRRTDRTPRILVSDTGHAAYFRAARYFDMAVDVIKTNPDGTIDLNAFEAAITPDTVLLVASAPSVVTGLIEPIEEIGRLAVARDLPFHVDACIGGFFLPFAEMLGKDLRLWDFRVPGVTTISADLHKYGFTAKGASVLLVSDPDLASHQPFEFGPPVRSHSYYSSKTMLGSRPGGAVASAWAVMRYLGLDGYKRLTQESLDYFHPLLDEVRGIDGLQVLGNPPMTVAAVAGEEGTNIPQVSAALKERGWLPKLDSLPVPNMRYMWSPKHSPFVPGYLDDLKAVVAEVRGGAHANKTEAFQY